MSASPREPSGTEQDTVAADHEPLVPEVDSDPVAPEPEAAAASLPAPLPSATTVPESTTRTKRRWRLVATVVSSVIGVVSFVTGIIAVVPILTRDATNFSSFTVSATPFPATSTRWALPLTTDFSSFPVAEDEICTAEQRDWLESAGTPVVTRLLVEMRNTASDGPMLALKDFRVVGERAAGAEAAILVECDSAPASVTQVQAAEIDASSEANIAVYSAAAYGVSQPGMPDIPLTWNLAPGETGQQVFGIVTSLGYEGALVATLISGEQSQTVTLGEELGALASPPLLERGRIFLRAAGSLHCLEQGVDGVVECELDGVLAAAR